MPSLRLSHDLDQLAADLDALRAGLGAQALRQGMNRAGDRGRTEMTRAITEEFAIKAGDVRAQVRVTKATSRTARDEIEVAIEAFGRSRGKRSRNVMLFAAKPAPGKARKAVRVQTAQGWRTFVVPVGGGVTVKIKKGGPRKLIKGAFIGNKGRTVFERTGSKRLPIKPVETIDVPQMFNTRRINARVVAKLGELLDLEVERAMSNALRRWSTP